MALNLCTPRNCSCHRLLVLIQAGRKVSTQMDYISHKKSHHKEFWRILTDFQNHKEISTCALLCCHHSINNGNRTEWSPICSVIIWVITKLYIRKAGVQFVNHEYDHRPTTDDTKSHYQLIISITIISDCKCPITCKYPINALIGGFINQSDSRKL